MLRVDEGFGRRLRKLRHDRGWTQAELGTHTEVRERQIIRWENNQHKPRYEHVAALARALGVPVAELMGDMDDEDEESALPLISDDVLDALAFAIEAAREKKARALA